MFDKLKQYLPSRREPRFHLVKRTDVPAWQTWLIRVGGIFAGLILAYLFLLIFIRIDPEATSLKGGYIGNRISVWGFLRGIGSGTFGFGTSARVRTRRSWITIRDTLILLGVGLALIPAFKMKFWNLGGNGQILMGDLMAIICMLHLGNAGWPDWAIILMMIPLSILAGIVWAVIPAVFKAFFNTNESLFTLMMNYIAAVIVQIFLTIAVPNGSGTLNSLSKGHMPTLGNAYVFPVLVIIVLFIFVYLYLRFAKHGYELEVVGESQNTARYIGINVRKVIIRTLVLSGAICGIIGLLLGSAINFSITATSDKNLGFTGTMVAWLAHFNPFFMIATAFIVTVLDKGVAQVMTDFGITSNAVSNIVIGLVYFAIIAAEFFVSYKIIASKPEEKAKPEAKTEPVLEPAGEPVADSPREDPHEEEAEPVAEELSVSEEEAEEDDNGLKDTEEEITLEQSDTVAEEDIKEEK